MLVDGKLMWQREYPTWAEDIKDALERYERRFEVKATTIEVHSDLDPSKITYEGVTVVKSPVVPSKNVFYVYRR